MEISGPQSPWPRNEVGMRAVGSMISILVVAAIGLFVYKSYFTQGQSTGAATPAQTINVVGVKNDLLAIAQAERAYQAEHGSVATLDELVSSGAMSMKKTGRDGYTYEVEPSGDGFRAIARCPAAAAGCTNYAVDQTMEVRAEP
jgi:hypothetical protein